MRMKKYFRYLILYMYCFCFILFIGCGYGYYPIYSAKEFLWNHPNIKLRIDGSHILNKYSSFSIWNYCGKILTIIEEDNEYEILISSKFQKVGNTNYWVRCAGTETLIPVPNFLTFQVRRDN